MCVICSQVLQAQKTKKPDCVLAMDIPSRMLVISSSEKEVVYRDRKTDAIMRLTKVGVADYGFNLEFTANQVFEELSQDPTYTGAKLEKQETPSLEFWTMEWSLSETAPNRRNDFNAMVMMDVCGQYYNFSLSMPSKKRDLVLPMFDEILGSLDTESPRGHMEIR